MRSACCLCLAVVAIAAARVSAEDFEVTDTGDSGAGTLRQAVLDANASADAASTITFNVPDSSTITLLTSLADITTTLTIDGTTAVNLTVAGNGTDQILRVAQTATSVIDVDLTSGPLEMAADTGLSFDLSSDAVFAGVIRDAGGLEKRGAAKLTLSGANTYSGGTLISEGTLQGDTTSLQGDIVNNGSLVFSLLFGVFSDEISGTGTLTLSSGFLSLTGDNSYTGVTTLDAGATLLTATQSLPGDASLASGSLLVFADVVDGTYAGDISGDGDVVVQQTGTLTFTGTHTHTGSTDLLGGTLIGNTNSFPGDITNSAALVFDQGFDATFSPVISGSGSFEKRGGGALTLSSPQTYTGLTTISAGRLDFAGSLGGAVQVDSAAVFGGAGTTGDLTIDGTVSPGTATGSVIAAADVTFNPGSVLVIGVNEVTADRVNASGTATIVDTTVTVVIEPDPGEYLAPVTVPILTSTSPVIGTFSATPLPTFAFLDTSLAPVGNTIELTVVSNGATFQSVAQTDNQRAVGAMLDGVSGSPDLDTVLASLKTLPTAEIPTALDAIGGEQLGQFPATEIATASRLDRAIQARIRGLSWRGGGQSPFSLGPGLEALPVAGGGPALGMTQRPVAARKPEEPSRLGAWLDGYGLLGNLEGDGNTDDLDYTIYGGTLGVDYRVGRHMLVGVSGGYAASDLDYDARAGSYDVDTYQGALYVGYARPGYYLGASARYALSEYDTHRTISFGVLDRTASGDFDGSTYGGHLEAGMDGFGVGRMVLQPVASFSYTHIAQDSYTESGAGSLNLSVDNEDVDSLVSGLGARLHGRFDMGEGMWMTPELRVRWTHEFGDEDRRVDARLNGATVGGDFVVESAEVGSDSLLLGLAWTVTTRDRLQVFAEYDAVLNDDLIEHSFSAGVRIIW